MKKKMLITGASGLLGNNLALYFKDKHDVLGLYNLHPVKIDGVETHKADISSETALNEIIQKFKPKIIIHSASLTNVDYCETDRLLTDKVNTLGTKLVTYNAIHSDAKLIYISTDSVYDGTKGDYTEEDETNPANYYGLSKYRGEQEILKRSGSVIFRTNLFGWNIQDKHSLAEWVINELSNKSRIKGFKDVYFSSIYTLEMAKIIEMAIDKDIAGIYNCGSRNSPNTFY